MTEMIRIVLVPQASEDSMSGAGQSSDGGAGQDTEADGEPPHEAFLQRGVEEEEEEAPPAAKQPRLEQDDVGLDVPLTPEPVMPSEETRESPGAAGTLEEGKAIFTSTSKLLIYSILFGTMSVFPSDVLICADINSICGSLADIFK